MFIQGIGQTFFLIGVPLFMILTGYLNIEKQISKQYYLRGIRVLIAYLFFSVVAIIFRKFYLHEDLTYIQWFLKITDFSAIPYGWYIEMWIGLYLLTPFVNILWHGVSSKQQHILLITLFVLTALPDFFNRYGVHLFPGYWAAIYPLMFYFAGAYIKEHQPAPPRHRLWTAIAAMCLINPVFNSLFLGQHTMLHVIGNGNGIIGVPLAIAFFLAFYRMQSLGNLAAKAIRRISIVSLDMYLVSFIFDTIFYAHFKEHYYINQSQFGIFFFAIVPLVFISSYLAAEMKEKIFRKWV